MAQYASDDGNGKAASSDVDQCLRYHRFLDETMLLLNWVQEQSQAYDRCQLTFKTEFFQFLKGLGGTGFLAFARNKERTSSSQFDEGTD